MEYNISKLALENKEMVELFENEEEQMQFECDTEEGNYKKYLKLYPDCLGELFAILIHNGYGDNEDILKEFIDHGLDINGIYKISRETDIGTLLLTAAENQDHNVIENLLKHGADPKLDYKNSSIVETVLCGHSCGDNNNVENIEKCMRFIEQYGGCNKVLRKVIFEDYAGECVAQSTYLKEFYESCELTEYEDDDIDKEVMIERINTNYGLI